MGVGGRSSFGRSQKGVSEDTGIEGEAGCSSVLGLEKRKMSMSLFTRRVAFWIRMFLRRWVFRIMLFRTPATDVEAKRTSRSKTSKGRLGRIDEPGSNDMRYW